MHLYHYRGIDSALKELNNETLHFSAKEELNDPVEGYVRVFWQSDKAAWEGLFQNYIISLYQAFTFYMLEGNEIDLHHNTLVIDIHGLDNVPLGDIRRELADKFLSDEHVKEVISLFADNKSRVSESELELALRFVHIKALYLCIKSDTSNGYISENEGKRILGLLKQVLLKKKEISYDSMEKAYADERITEDARIVIAREAEGMAEDIIELQLISLGVRDDDFLYGKRQKKEKAESEQNDFFVGEETAGQEDSNASKKSHHVLEKNSSRQHRNWLAIYADFPQIYVEQLKDMIYPEGYAVCFSANDDDSAMWGNYADEHKGVCLIYDIENPDSSRAFCPCHYAMQNVEYGGEIVERNFFETFGRLTYSQIKSWLTGVDGSISKSMDVFKNEETWRDSYWDAFKAKWFHKLPAWSHEEEYRLVNANTFGEYTEASSRNVKYDLHYLKGVIFGIKTSEYDKMKIVNVLRGKKNLAEDFKFYQAYYDDAVMDIKKREKVIWNANRATVLQEEKDK